MKTLDHFFSPRNRKGAKTLLSTSPESSTSSVATPSTALTLTPRTPPSPAFHDDVTLTPPTPQSASTPASLSTPPVNYTDKMKMGICTNNSEIRTPPSPTTPLGSPSLSIKTKKRAKRKRQTEQLYLDLGQSSFGSRTICPICNMLYVNGIKEDEDNHRKVCNEYANGVAFNMWKHARVVYVNEKKRMKSPSTGRSPNLLSVWNRNKSATAAISGGSGGGRGDGNTESGGCVVEVRGTDPIQLRRKVLRVKSIVDQELGFYQPSNDELSYMSNADVDDETKINNSSSSSSSSFGGKTIYIYIYNKRVVGFCSVEVLLKAFRLHPEKDGGGDDAIKSNANGSGSVLEEGGSCTTEASKAMMGVHQLWCHRSHRKKKIATMLVDAARSKLVYGLTVPVDMVAFSSPTLDGARFARKFGNTLTPLVYDCK